MLWHRNPGPFPPSTPTRVCKANRLCGPCCGPCARGCLPLPYINLLPHRHPDAAGKGNKDLISIHNKSRYWLKRLLWRSSHRSLTCITAPWPLRPFQFLHNLSSPCRFVREAAASTKNSLFKVGASPKVSPYESNLGSQSSTTPKRSTNCSRERLSRSLKAFPARGHGRRDLQRFRSQSVG